MSVLYFVLIPCAPRALATCVLYSVNRPENFPMLQIHDHFHLLCPPPQFFPEEVQVQSLGNIHPEKLNILLLPANEGHPGIQVGDIDIPFRQNFGDAANQSGPIFPPPLSQKVRSPRLYRDPFPPLIFSVDIQSHIPG